MKNNTYFKLPSLQSDGTLLPSDGLAIYQHYLNTERQDFNNQMRRPCRSQILKAMIETNVQQKIDASQMINNHLNEKQRVLFWSDQHFFHNNIIEYSSRPFNDMQHMNKTMLSNYFSNVQENDLVVFGGDVSFGDVENTKSLLKNLPGKKILVLGNHDFDKNKMIFRDYKIFDAVTMSLVFSQTIENKIMNVLVTHYPIENKFIPENTINVHGHIHQHEADKKNINISVEHMNYMPQNLEEKLMNKFKELYL